MRSVRFTASLVAAFTFSAAAAAVAAGCGDSSRPSTFRGGANDSPDAARPGDTPPGASLGEVSADKAGGTKADGGACEPNLTGVVRDFRRGDKPGGHPDFETFMGQGEKGIVSPQLGADGKPVYASAGPTAHTSGRAGFDQWYRDTPGVNDAIPFRLNLVQGAGGIFTFESADFFPIDARGFGNEGEIHNYGFTFELHTEFVYKGGEVFTFRGDDDLWTFINGHLAIDLGGLHAPQTGSVALDAAAAALGIERGKTYPLDVFHAERHTVQSNFRIDTTIEFTNCAPILK